MGETVMIPEDSYNRSNLATAVNALPLPSSWKEERLKPDAIELVLDAVRKAVAEEREACGKLAEEAYHENAGAARGLPEIHVSIRARKDE